MLSTAPSYVPPPRCGPLYLRSSSALRLVEVQLRARLQVVIDATLHRRVHPQRAELGLRHPADACALAAGRWRAPGRSTAEEDREFLACLAVAGVEDDVLGIGVDAEHVEDLAVDARLFL